MEFGFDHFIIGVDRNCNQIFWVVDDEERKSGFGVGLRPTLIVWLGVCLGTCLLARSLVRSFARPIPQKKRVAEASELSFVALHFVLVAM